MTDTTPQDRGQDRGFASRLARLAYELKGEDIVILDVYEQLRITDFFVIATGLNERHLRAMAEQIDLTIKKEDGRLKNHGEGMKNERWVLLDYGTVVVHLFHPAAREHYDLEFLWAAAPRVDWKEAEAETEAESKDETPE
jgi:ribosome-associated protein